VLEGACEVPVLDDDTIRAALAEQLSSGVSVRDAVSHVEEALGVAHRTAYLLALELRAENGAGQ